MTVTDTPDPSPGARNANASPTDTAKSVRRSRPPRDAARVVSTLLAIDVLLQPDAAARERALALNARLRRDLPLGFAFDATHHPHVTLLQRYVARDDLERVAAAVGQVAAGADAEELIMRATGISGGAFGTPAGTSLVSVEFELTPAVRDLHERVAAALLPFSRTGGDGDAFFAAPGEPPAGTAIIGYVEEFVPAHSGERFEPHMSVGVGGDEFARELHAAPLEPFRFRPRAIGLAHLGEYGATPAPAELAASLGRRRRALTNS